LPGASVVGIAIAQGANCDGIEADSSTRRLNRAKSFLSSARHAARASSVDHHLPTIASGEDDSFPNRTCCNSIVVFFCREFVSKEKLQTPRFWTFYHRAGSTDRSPVYPPSIGGDGMRLS